MIKIIAKFFRRSKHTDFALIITLLLVILVICAFISLKLTEQRETNAFIYDINDTVGTENAILITWRTPERTFNDFLDVGTSRNSYQFKAIAKHTDSGLYHWANLTGLDNNTTYHYRITSVDSTNITRAATNDRTFKTYDRNYDTIGALDVTIVKEPDSVWLISKDQEKRTFSLGAYKVSIGKNTFLLIPRFWVLFSSDALSARGDSVFGLQDAYLSRILLRKNSKTEEVSLGKSGEHMLIELGDYPFGNLNPQNKDSGFEFEIMVELACNNFQNNACLDNQGEPLDYLNTADIKSEIRLFINSFQSFEKIINTDAKFKYE